MRCCALPYVTLFLLTTHLAPAEVQPAAPRELARWTRVALPIHGSYESSNINHRCPAWTVQLANGEPIAISQEFDEVRDPLPFPIPPDDDRNGDRHALRVEDGWLVGFDQGEWGGSLWWFSTDGKHSYRVTEDQVRGLYPTSRGVLAIEGLAHGGISTGHVVRVTRGKSGTWKARRITDLRQAPETATLDDDKTLVVATARSLVRVTQDGNIHTMISRAFWWSLVPNSMVLTPSGDLYLGMRHGVAVIRSHRKNRTVEWLVPVAPAKETDS